MSCSPLLVTSSLRPSQRIDPSRRLCDLLGGARAPSRYGIRATAGSIELFPCRSWPFDRASSPRRSTTCVARVGDTRASAPVRTARSPFGGAVAPMSLSRRGWTPASIHRRSRIRVCGQRTARRPPGIRHRGTARRDKVISRPRGAVARGPRTAEALGGKESF